MTKQILINSCDDCPLVEFGDTKPGKGSLLKCSSYAAQGKIIGYHSDIQDIPKWCPLTDYPAD